MWIVFLQIRYNLEINKNKDTKKTTISDQFIHIFLGSLHHKRTSSIIEENHSDDECPAMRNFTVDIWCTRQRYVNNGFFAFEKQQSGLIEIFAVK